MASSSVVSGANGSTGDDASSDLAVSVERAVEEERGEVIKLGKELSTRRKEVYDLQDRFEGSVRKLEKSQKALKRTKSSGGGKAEKDVEVERMRAMLPVSGGWFVEMFLGRVNVRMGSKRERLRLKEEYELLKQKLAPVFVGMCVLCLIFEDNRWLHMLLQLGLSTYYLSLALRENILRANGSNIRSWWIIHHYLTIWQGVVLLTWPNGESYGRWRTSLHYFGLYNALLQIFQTRYQIARLYTLRSLGKAGEMDVANSDSTQFHWSESMRFLLPLIALGQIMQAWQAISLLFLYREYPLELQILLLGLLFCATFSGNFITTVIVVMDKRKGEKGEIAASQERQTSQEICSSVQSEREKTE